MSGETANLIFVLFEEEAIDKRFGGGFELRVLHHVDYTSAAIVIACLNADYGDDYLSEMVVVYLLSKIFHDR